MNLLTNACYNAKINLPKQTMLFWMETVILILSQLFPNFVPLNK